MGLSHLSHEENRESCRREQTQNKPILILSLLLDAISFDVINMRKLYNFLHKKGTGKTIVQNDQSHRLYNAFINCIF